MARWVLLRGWARESRHWGRFPETLAAAMPGDEVSALDLAGNGARFRERSPTSVAGMVDDYRRELARRAPGHGVSNLLALSLGGMVAIDWARRYPQEIGRVVLLNASIADLSPVTQRLKPSCYLNLLQAALGSAEFAESAIVSMTINRPDPQLPKKWAAYRRECPVSGLNVLRQLLAAARFRLGDEIPGQPFLLLASAADRLVDVSCSRAISLRTKWPLLEHQGAGHDLPIDDPDWVADAITDWQAERAASPTATISPLFGVDPPGSARVRPDGGPSTP